MNILPKKRWHVRTKDNIARVRRDEAEALEKEQEIQKRARFAEQESRIDFLRQKARSKNDQEDTADVLGQKARSENEQDDIKEKPATKDDNIYTNSGNINFFKEIEAGLQGGSSTKKEEERKEKEAYEKKIGILTQLGQDSMELSGGKYWYESKSHFTFYKDQETDNKEVGLKHKISIDPLTEILKHTSSTYHPPKIINKSQKQDIITPSSTSNRLKTKKNKKSKRKKDKKLIKCLKKKLKEKRAKKHCSSDSESEMEKLAVMKKLRKERLEREATEKLRTARLLAGKHPDGKDDQPIKESYQKYNSQFNPNYARQNRN